jgi:hypothetical protein
MTELLLSCLLGLAAWGVFIGICFLASRVDEEGKEG